MNLRHQALLDATRNFFEVGIFFHKLTRIRDARYSLNLRDSQIILYSSPSLNNTSATGVSI